MREWNKRSVEIKYLLNPAFCGRVLLSFAKEYETRSGSPTPFSLIYLVLPLALHGDTRDRISTRAKPNLARWTHENNDLLIGFADRAKGLVGITNEAFEFLLCARIVELTDEGCFKCSGHVNPSGTEYVDEEVSDCLSKAKYIAKWFSDSHSAANVYFYLGVRP